MLPPALQDEPVTAGLDAAIAGAIVEGMRDRGEIALIIAPERIVETCRYLKAQQVFERLSGVTAVDWHPHQPRFEVVYHLHSLTRNQRIRLKCRLGEANPEIDSVTPVWHGANWYEREVFDLFGIRFRGHGDLKRIMLPENWEGHPLRKDYPVHGYKYSYKDEA
jgi:NADH-quinone oxidoreductase subunit C